MTIPIFKLGRCDSCVWGPNVKWFTNHICLPIIWRVGQGQRERGSGNDPPHLACSDCWDILTATGCSVFFGIQIINNFNEVVVFQRRFLIGLCVSVDGYLWFSHLCTTWLALLFSIHIDKLIPLTSLLLFVQLCKFAILYTFVCRLFCLQVCVCYVNACALKLVTVTPDTIHGHFCQNTCTVNLSWLGIGCLDDDDVCTPMHKCIHVLNACCSVCLLLSTIIWVCPFSVWCQGTEFFGKSILFSINYHRYYY